jgi:hypothetical protein
LLINLVFYNLKEVIKMKHLIGVMFCLLVFATPSVMAEEVVTPFIKDKYFKQNITLEAFRSNPREYFRSESAFNLLVGYVESEINHPLTSAEFIALMNDRNQVRSRKCPTTESVRVGGLSDDQFFWITRKCRSGEEIVQLRLNDRWIDVFSLNCLNAKEDTTPVAPPVLVAMTPVQHVSAEPIQRTHFSDSVSSDWDSFQSGVFGGNQCGGIFFAPGGNFQMGDTIESRGYSRTGEYYNEY